MVSVLVLSAVDRESQAPTGNGKLTIVKRGRCDRDHVVVGFTTTCAISAYRH
jgi:hypothetical protein